MAVGEEQIELELQVQGMSCQHCVAAVTEALQRVPGVESSNVDLGAGRVKVRAQAGLVERPQLVEAIRAAGYEAS